MASGERRRGRKDEGAASDPLSFKPFVGLKPERADASPKSAPPALPRPSAPPPSPSEETLFLEAAAGAVPLRAGDRLPCGAPPARLPDPLAEEREGREALEALVSGEAPFHVAETTEFIEGAVDGVDRRTRLRLRRGELSVQAHLDLHGQTREEARASVERFLREQRQRGHRCVLIVHGRGLNSKDQIPVLKEQLSRWLARGALARSVLAFCTARPCDGGGGAIYVLLRR